VTQQRILNRVVGRGTLAVASGLLAAVCLVGSAAAQPSLSSVVPSRTPANTGATVTVFGSGIGNGSDLVQFPGPVNVAPTGWGAGFVTVPVPATWSGPIYVRNGVTGLWSSNSLALDISYSWARNQWAGAAFTWFLQQNGSPGNTVNDTRDALINGYNAWSCASNLGITYGGTTATLPNNQADGVNVQGWVNSGWSASTIALTSWVYIIATGNIREFDIAYNSQHFTWSAAGAAGSMDVGNIGTHEEGHSVGFLDLYGGADANDTMYGYGANGEVIRRTLNLDDVEGAEFVYPRTGRPNLAASTPGGWYLPVVPRAAADAGSGYAPAPALLNGNATSYVSINEHNWGLDCAAPASTLQLWVDDSGPAWYLWWNGVVGAGGDVSWFNAGTYVPGGRHTLEARYDTDASIVESNEGDNVYRAQYVWSPFGLADQVAWYRNAPPDRGVFSAANCDGLQFTGNWWGAVGVIPSTAGDDYDLQLFGDYANATTGFSTVLASSASGGQYTDFVLVNGNAVGYGQTRQAGVDRYAAGAGGSYLVQQSNQVGATLYPGTTYAAEVSSGSVPVGAYDVLKVHEVYLGDTANSYRFTLDGAGAADLDFGLYAAGASYYGKFDAVASSWGVGAGGDEFFTYQPPATGYYAVVVFKKTNADIGQSGSYELRVGRALANLYAGTTPGGWSWPVVPRDLADANFGYAPASATLPGNAWGTWLNYSIHQQGPGTMPAWGSNVYLDEDEFVAWASVGADNAPTIYEAHNIGQVFMRGGRHSLTHVLDPGNAVPESNEYDNEWRGQWIWSPLELAKEVPVVRYAPPNPGYFSEPNADGAHFAHTSGYAWVTAVAPRNPGDDYDMYLYDDYSGASAGFSNRRATSTYGGNSTDFAVGQYQSAASVYPAAVRYYPGGGAGDFAMDQSDASLRNLSYSGSYVDVLLAADRLADVYEVYLNQNQLTRVKLTRTDGASDLACNIYPATSGGIYGRPDALAFSSPATPDHDLFVFDPPAAGWYPLVVFRETGTGADTPATYTLEVGAPAPTDVSDGPDPVPTTLAFQGVFPNPALDRTTFSFSLPVQGRVSLEVYDLRGRRVAVLEDGELAPGSHQIVWNGRDTAGGAVASGVYQARLRAQGRVLTQRVNIIR